jgi:hypothetical protein
MLTFEGSLTLSADSAPVTAIFGEGGARQSEPPLEHPSEIANELNTRFGLTLGDRDQLIFDQFEETWLGDPHVLAQARGNSLENFRLVLDNRFMGTLVSRMDDNEAIFKCFLDDDEFRQILMDLCAGRVYRRARATFDHRRPKDS